MSQHQDLADSAKEDLKFIQWVRDTTSDTLQKQWRFAVGWQKVAIERELNRRLT